MQSIVGAYSRRHTPCGSVLPHTRGEAKSGRPKELNQLLYSRRVAQAGNFSRAAELCHVSQPSLSQQILKLEKELGQRLLDRLGRHAVLTDAGRLLLDRATGILSAVDDTTHRLKDYDHLEA